MHFLIGIMGFKRDYFGWVMEFAHLGSIVLVYELVSRGDYYVIRANVRDLTRR